MNQNPVKEIPALSLPNVKAPYQIKDGVIIAEGELVSLSELYFCKSMEVQMRLQWLLCLHLSLC
jgi:hypothetical protein